MPYKDPTTTHQKLLDLLGEKWIEMAGRDKIAKRKLPKKAYDPSPNFVVADMSEDEQAEDVTVQFLMMYHKPRFSYAHWPSTLGWYLAAPSGETFFIFNWVNWKRNTASLFREFCEKTGRVFGTLTPEGTLDLGSRSISLFDCEIVHENERKRRRRRHQKSEAGEDSVATARKLLRRKTDSCEELEWFEFRNDKEAHDRELTQRVQKSFVRTFNLLREKLSAKFGDPVKTGNTEHKLIPRNGILEYAIWNIRGKSLFTAVSYEDVGLPVVLYLGVTQ